MCIFTAFDVLVVKYCSGVEQLGNTTANTTDHHYNTYVQYELVWLYFISIIYFYHCIYFMDMHCVI